MRLLTLLALVATLSSCAKQERTDPARPATAMPDAGVQRRDALAANDEDAGGEPARPRTDYAAIAEEACRMSGGECVAKSECGAEVGAELPNVCRPGVPGLTCCRKPASDCPGYETASCCRTLEGRLTNSGASCDRGYPSCLGFSDEYHLAADRECKVPLAEAAKDAPNRWPGTIGAEAAGKWACAQAGGKTVKTRAECDGYLVALATDPCCLPRSVCPEMNAGTECCQRSGMLYPKECVSGRAVCPAALLGLGTMREVAAGTCRSF